MLVISELLSSTLLCSPVLESFVKLCVYKHLSSSVLRRYHQEDSKARLSNLGGSEDRLFNLEVSRDRLFHMHNNSSSITVQK